MRKGLRPRLDKFNHNIGRGSSVSKASRTTSKNTDSKNIRQGVRNHRAGNEQHDMYAKVKRVGGIGGSTGTTKNEHMTEIQLNPQRGREQSYDN